MDSWLLPVRKALLGPDGISTAQPSIPDTWGLFAVWNSDEAILIGIVVLLVAAITLLVGWHSRIAAVIVFVLVVSFERRSPWVFNSGDALIRIEAFLLAVSPCGAALSLDERRRSGSFWAAQTRPNWPIRLLQIQLSIVYLAAVQSKLAGQPWLDGTAVSYVLRIEDMKRIPVPQWLTMNAPVMNAMTWGVLAIELAVGILVWFPRFRRMGAGRGRADAYDDRPDRPDRHLQLCDVRALPRMAFAGDGEILARQGQTPALTT